MAVFIIRRLLQVIPTLWIIATLTFVLMKLTPGGPFDDEKQVSPEVKALIEAHYGLDQPLHVQYTRFIWQRLRGDFGPSYKYVGWDVDEIIAQYKEFNCDMIIMGIKEGLIRQKAISPIVKNVMRKSDVPVVIVPPETVKGK